MQLSVDRQYEARRRAIMRRMLCRRVIVIAALLAAAWIAAVVMSHSAAARWRPAYGKADPQIRAWYGEQHNSQGQWCCDEADGHPYFGAYTLNDDGSVTLDLAAGPVTIPAFKVLTGPNPTGHAVWWYRVTGEDHVRTDFCFAPGTLT